MATGSEAVKPPSSRTRPRLRCYSRMRSTYVSCVRLLSLSLVWMYGCGRADLFEAPPRGTPPSHQAPHEQLTTLTLVTRIPYDSIRTLITNQVPSSINLSGDGHVACTDVPFVDPGGIESHEKCADVPYCDISWDRQVCGTRRQCIKLPDTVRPPRIGTREQCADYAWIATVSREGLPVVARSGDAIHLELPVRIGGKAGLKGDLAALLSLSGKNFEAHLRPGVDVKLSVGADWCPAASVSPTNRWVTSASVEVVGRNCISIDLGALGHPEVCAGPVNVGLTDQANSAIEANQGNLSRLATSAFNCEAMRKAVAAQWHPWVVPLSLDESNQEASFLNVTPIGFAFSGLGMEDDAARVALKVWATTRIEPTAVEPTPLELPQISPFDSHASRLSVELSAKVPYSTIIGVLGGAIRGKDFSANTQAGRVTVHIDDVTAYTSTLGLAVGVKIDANLPGHLLNTKGWVYLVGKPKATSSGSGLQIEDLQYATVVDNGLWGLIVAVFDSQILREIRDRSTVDLKESITKSARELAAKVNAASVRGIKLSAQVPTASLEDFVLGDDALMVAVSANMDFAIELNPEVLASNTAPHGLDPLP